MCFEADPKKTSSYDTVVAVEGALVDIVVGAVDQSRHADDSAA